MYHCLKQQYPESHWISVWGSVLKFINFNKIWEVINECDVYCKQICSNFFPRPVRNFMRSNRLTSIFRLKLCANWASLNYSFDFWIHARPEDDVCSLSQAWSNSLMAGVYSWKPLRPHSFRNYHSLTLKQNCIVERNLFYIIPVIANLYWASLSFLWPSVFKVSRTRSCTVDFCGWTSLSGWNQRGWVCQVLWRKLESCLTSTYYQQVRLWTNYRPHTSVHQVCSWLLH